MQEEVAQGVETFVEDANKEDQEDQGGEDEEIGGGARREGERGGAGDQREYENDEGCRDKKTGRTIRP